MSPWFVIIYYNKQDTRDMYCISCTKLIVKAHYTDLYKKHVKIRLKSYMSTLSKTKSLITNDCTNHIFLEICQTCSLVKAN